MRFIENLSVKHSLLIIAVALLTSYAPSFQGDFQFDDEYFIVRNQDIKSFQDYGQLHYWLDLQKRTLTRLTLSINYYIHGLNTIGYHIINLLVHFASSLFLFFLIKELFNNKIKNAYILLATLIFACHPMQTQAVTYIVQRMASLSGMFYIGSIYFFLRGRKMMVCDSLKTGIIFVFISAIFMLAGMLSKQNAITIPVVLALIELIFIFPKNKKKSIFFSLPFIIASTIAIIYLINKHALPVTLFDNDSLNYATTQSEVLFRYIILYLFPYGLNIDHMFPIATSFEIRHFIYVSIHFLIITTGFFLIRKKPIVSFAILFFYVSHLTESSFIFIQDTMVEHRMYVPSISISLLLAHFLVKYNRFIIKPTIVVVSVLTILTFFRNSDYKTKISLWTASIEHQPSNRRAYYNLAYSYSMIHEWDKAEEYNEVSMNIGANEFNWLLKAEIELQKGNSRNVEFILKKTNPKHNEDRLLCIKARLAEMKGLNEQAFQYYRAIDYSKHWVGSYYYYKFLQKAFDDEYVEAELLKQTEGSTDNLYAHYVLAKMYHKQNNCAETLKHLQPILFSKYNSYLMCRSDELKKTCDY